MTATIETPKGFQGPRVDEPAILVSKRDGRVLGQSRAANALLGEANERSCWSLMLGVPGAERLPCMDRCVSERLSSNSPVEVRSVGLRGRTFELRCEPVGDQIVTTLHPVPEDPPTDSPRLTPREIEVLELLAEGMEGSEIADRLSICRGTVRAHVEHMRVRLGCRTRAGLVAQGYRLHYLVNESAESR